MDLLAAAKPTTPPTIRRRLRRRNSSFKISVIPSLIISVLAILAPFLIDYLFPSVKSFFLQLVPRSWSFFSECLTRSYLFGLLNFIIVAIVAMTHIHQKSHRPQQSRPQLRDLSSIVEASKSTVVTEMIHSVDDINTTILSCEEATDMGEDRAKKNIDQPEYLGFATTEGSNPNEATAFPIGRTDSSELSQPDDYDSKPQGSISVKEESELGTRTHLDRPLSSSRFSNRKAGKWSNDQSKSLRISRPLTKNDTLEATWKKISEGRLHPPLINRHRKSETWDSPRSRLGTLSPANSQNEETLSTATIHCASMSTSPNKRDHYPRIRMREPSIGREELNKRVESFIDQFNEQIRLQRQESLLKYVQAMVDRSA